MLTILVLKDIFGQALDFSLVLHRHNLKITRALRDLIYNDLVALLETFQNLDEQIR